VHELSLCHAIAGVVTPRAAGRRVDVVRVRVGALRQVVPDSLSFCWTLMRDFAGLAGAELELELIAAAVSCRSCGEEADIASRFSVACPGCGSADVEVIRGEEFMVTSIEVSDSAAAESPEGVASG
jgi:hydrogenase nickel incorporation protein HypA/HybF